VGKRVDALRGWLRVYQFFTQPIISPGCASKKNNNTIPEESWVMTGELGSSEWLVVVIIIREKD
jgi:hypothetical protein